MSKKKIIFYIVTALLLLLIIYFFYIFRHKAGRVLTPFFYAVIVAYMVKPIALRLQKKGIQPTISILAVYLFFISAFTAAAVFVIPEVISNIKDLMNSLPEMLAKYQKLAGDFIYSIKSSKWSDDIKIVVFNEIQNGVDAARAFFSDALKKSMNLIIDIVTLVFDFTVAMVIAYYLIKDGDAFREFSVSMLPRRWRSGAISLGREINKVLKNFIQGQLLTAFIVGFTESIGLIIVQMKYPLVLGAIGGIANIIPYFGPYIGAVPAVAVAIMESPLKALWVVIVFAVVQQIDNSFISPKVIEGKLGLHPVTTIFAVLAGGEFFGLAGMLLAVPAVAVLRIVIKKTADAVSSK